ncbi:DNA-binding transcriptional regulator LsrR (DeoR family) [Rhodoglobus vestalii]|uniref:DNA-binding transcriptional regulator LsrR (DeoR family) n=1 Tax=Rhodoglobus vestalii TaxID=193384 RepID=A0A8H2K867_9MICO|nr:sugar-binding domain-containing protein [Rhodoglobus vestalii]TQO20684.1 DNA-binding transcriptional regulator LsrR (DeoR family) [Rhodoglobus vestalii]
MLGRVAALHYLHGMNHQEIADLLGLSRVQVTRALAKARREGIVEIRIHSDEPIFPDLQVALASRYGIASTWIAPSFPEPNETLASVGTLGAACLQSALRPGATVAVGLSTTLASIAPHFGPDQLDVTIVPAIGSRPGARRSVSPHEVARQLADAAGARAYHLPAPYLASSKLSAAMIRSEPDVASALELARHADIGLFGLGGVTHGSGTVVDTTMSDEKVSQLIARGAVGDISGSFFDLGGRFVTGPVDDRMIGLTYAEILALPVRIGVAFGRDKVQVIKAALTGGIITALVTDYETANALTT